jgi:hypothetical protein
MCGYSLCEYSMVSTVQYSVCEYSIYICGSEAIP